MLSAMPEQRQVYSDDKSVVLVRRGAAESSVADASVIAGVSVVRHI